jgi:transcriptional regulator GlxA family with amidase domain
MAKQVRRVCSICTGAYLLADAGLLEGKRATTHWRFVESFARKHPGVTWDPNPIFVKDGNIYTSAGISAGMDLTLALIEEDYGSALALEVARYMVIYLRRPGSQAQFSVALCRRRRPSERACRICRCGSPRISRRICRGGSGGTAAMSARNFARVFVRELGKTPARYVEQVRVEAARTQLASTDDSVDQIASRCGFSSAELLRRCFLRHFKVAPSQYRKHFRRRTHEPACVYR